VSWRGRRERRHELFGNQDGIWAKGGLGSGDAPAQATVPIEGANKLLTAFKHKPISKPLPKTPKETIKDARDAYWEGRWEDVLSIYRDAATHRDAKNHIRDMMIGEDAGRQALAEDPNLAGVFLSAVDPKSLDDGLDGAFGRKKDDMVAAALLEIARKRPGGKDGPIDRDAQCDPALVNLLAEKIGPDVWNDTGKAIGAPRRGLGPRVCAALWHSGGYDEICELIKLGVDTTVAAQSETSGGLGVYSDFVQPIQHTIQEHLRDVAKLGTEEAKSWDEKRKEQAQGAQKIFQALEKSGKAVTLTKWGDVQGSEMIQEFTKKPGTIWGFEDIRLPYVQAAHETTQGVQPLRMMELWDVVSTTLNSDESALPARRGCGGPRMKRNRSITALTASTWPT
jgi:hypothetical protein